MNKLMANKKGEGGFKNNISFFLLSFLLFLTLHTKTTKTNYLATVQK